MKNPYGTNSLVLPAIILASALAPQANAQNKISETGSVYEAPFRQAVYQLTGPFLITSNKTHTPRVQIGHSSIRITEFHLENVSSWKNYLSISAFKEVRPEEAMRVAVKRLTHLEFPGHKIKLGDNWTIGIGGSRKSLHSMQTGNSITDYSGPR